MRCRKRKIRCSGDPGNGQPCNNCKNAGSEPCRFLRVSRPGLLPSTPHNLHSPHYAPIPYFPPRPLLTSSPPFLTAHAPPIFDLKITDTPQVSSQETPLRNDSGDFTFDLGQARAYKTRPAAPSLGPVPGAYSPEGVPAMPAGEIMGAYRGGSYAYSGKGYYGVSAWSPQGYEDGVDYGLQWVFPWFLLGVFPLPHRGWPL